MSIKVIVNGAFGKMGRVTCEHINQAPDLELVAKLGHGDDLVTEIKASRAEVVIDFTAADVVFGNVTQILEAGVSAVVGTSGLKAEQLHVLSQQAEDKQLGVIVAPNFSIGGVLMMKYAADAVKYLPNAEVIEMHHQGKRDAPSGTAMKTCEMMANAREKEIDLQSPQIETIRGSRGANYLNIPVHAVRLPGLVAHQQVIFGSTGETLTIRHDSTSRDCFMPGVLLACRRVVALKSLVYGLEHLL